jgi:protein O-GlcNAc transferase
MSEKEFQRKKMTMQAIETQARILYPSCPLCSSPDIPAFLKANCSRHPLYNPILGPVMTWKKCRGCAHVFTEGYFTPDAARIIFSKTHDYQKTGNDIEKHRYISSRMVEKILPFADSGDWLDIGFGNGSLLFTAHEYGFNPVGIDLREGNVSALKQFGIEAHCIDLNKLDHHERYSVVSLADVLEHIPYPKEALNSVYKLLKNDAVTLISLPNMDSVLWQALNNAKGNPYWGEIEHYHNFGRTRLYTLLNECGFEPLLYGISHRYRACMEIIAKKIRK